MNERSSVQNRGSASDVFNAALNRAEKLIDSAPIVSYYHSSIKSNDNGTYDVTINDNGNRSQLTDVNYSTAISTTGDYSWTDPWPYKPYPSVQPQVWPIRVPVIWEDYPTWKKSDLRRFVEDIHKLAKEVPNKLPSNVVSGSFPPSNLFLTENKDLVIQCALAGYSLDEIDIEYENEYITVKLSKPRLPFKTKKEIENLPEDERPITIKSYMQRGIKFDDGSVKFYVDRDKFDAEGATIEFENGLLTIIIPKAAHVDKKTKFTISKK